MSFPDAPERFWKPPLALERITDLKTIRRFLSKVEQTEEGHWLWKGAINSRGYGLFKYQGHVLAAHRISYAIFNGPIPDGQTIHHLPPKEGEEPVRVDCNPAHLQLSTLSENSREGSIRRWESVVKSVPF
jgi:hypothetical protein